MATSPTHCSTHEHGEKVKSQSSSKTPDMEVKAHLITGPELQGSTDTKQRAERMVELQERRRSLQALLGTRLAELKRVCLQEAELTGELPNEFPLEAGENPPHVKRRVGPARSGSKSNLKCEEEDASQRKSKKTLFSGALRRHVEAEQQLAYGKRTTVHRGCHTETVKSESSSMSDSTSQETEDISDGPSPSQPRLVPGSPDSRFCRKLSPVEIYYEMKARRNSVSSSASPSRSLPRSMSNLEGRSVPATPRLTRSGPIGVHVRSESSSSTSALKQRSDNPELTQAVLVASQDVLSPGHLGCSYSAQTRRSNSSDALLDRCVEEAQFSGPMVRNGSHKSSEALLDSRLKQVNGHAEVTRVRSISGGRASSGSGGVYSDVLLDYVWGKQQKMQQMVQQQQRLQAHNSIKARAWHEAPSIPPPPYINGFSPTPSLILSSAPPAYSPLMLRGKPGEPRRVKVSRTKSCGPFIPVQQGYTEIPVVNGHNAMGQLQPRQRPPNYSTDLSSGSTPQDEPTRNLHKALALEGLRDWYLRNALGQPGSVCTGKGQEVAASQRRRTTAPLHPSQPPLKQQAQSFQGDTAYTHLPQSATFHGHPLRSADLSPFQETFSSKMEDLTLKEINNDRPCPGTLV